jgi:hypothetical protein
MLLSSSKNCRTKIILKRRGLIMAMICKTKDVYKIDIFLSNNNERQALAIFFEHGVESLLRDDSYEHPQLKSLSHGTYLRTLRDVVESANLKDWARQIRADSGKCRVYRISYIFESDLPFRNPQHLTQEKAQQMFEDLKSGYNKTLRDFTDKGKLKDSLDA